MVNFLKNVVDLNNGANTQTIECTWPNKNYYLKKMYETNDEEMFPGHLMGG